MKKLACIFFFGTTLTGAGEKSILYPVFAEKVKMPESRSVAQPGSAFASGAKGRGFKSLRSDQLTTPDNEGLGFFFSLVIFDSQTADMAS